MNQPEPLHPYGDHLILIGSEFPGRIDDDLAALAGKGFGGKIVRDQNDQLSPPELAAWTGAKFRLILCCSGRMVWMELQEFTKMGRIPIKQLHNPEEFPAAVLALAVAES